MTTPLISVDFLKTFMPIRAGNTQYDAKLNSLIKDVSATFESVTNRSFLKQEYTEFFNSRETAQQVYDFAGDSLCGTMIQVQDQTIRLSVQPLDETADLSIYYDRTRQFPDACLIDPSRYFVTAQDSSIILNYGMRTGAKTIKVVYTAGYALDNTTKSLVTSLPDDLKMAAVRQVMHMWNKTQPASISNTAEEDDSRKTRAGTSGGAQWIVKGGLLPDVVEALGGYHRVLTGKG